jgi:hypothetical protein
MTTKEFVQTIRKIIQEEVQKSVRKEIQVMLNESKNQSFVQPNYDPIDFKTESLRVKPRPAKAPKQYSKNPMLNDILNETAPLKGDSNYLAEAFGNGVDYNNYEEWPTMRSMPTAMSGKIGVASMVPTTDTEGRPVQNVHVPEEVASALTRDYSSLMKAINKKKGG